MPRAMLQLMKCPDTFALLTRRLNAHYLLLLSMCCRDMRIAVDESMHRMASLFSTGIGTTHGMQEYKEYAKEVVLRINCAENKLLRYRLKLCFTGTVCTVMIGGMMTVMNGAFTCHAGDLVQWYFDEVESLFNTGDLTNQVEGERKTVVVRGIVRARWWFFVGFIFIFNF